MKHQEETLVRLAIGGTLGSIAESGAGTLAGNAQANPVGIPWGLSPNPAGTVPIAYVLCNPAGTVPIA